MIDNEIKRVKDFLGVAEHDTDYLSRLSDTEYSIKVIENEFEKLKAENERLNVIIKEYEKKLWKGRK